MSYELSQSDLERIVEELEEYASGIGGFLDHLRGEGESEEPEEVDVEEFPWKPAFFLLAATGRVNVYKRILKDHAFEMDDYTGASINCVLEEVYEYVLENKEEIEEQAKQAFDYLLQAYREGYGSREPNQLGWNFDDFLEERDLIEFFLLGHKDHFSSPEFSVALFEEDCRVRERINELGLENYAEEYFPGRQPWYPKRFWWHHRPEDRIPHPDGLES